MSLGGETRLLGELVARLRVPEALPDYSLVSAERHDPATLRLRFRAQDGASDFVLDLRPRGSEAPRAFTFGDVDLALPERSGLPRGLDLYWKRHRAPDLVGLAFDELLARLPPPVTSTGTAAPEAELEEEAPAPHAIAHYSAYGLTDFEFFNEWLVQTKSSHQIEVGDEVDVVLHSDRLCNYNAAFIHGPHEGPVRLPYLEPAERASIPGGRRTIYDALRIAVTDVEDLDFVTGASVRKLEAALDGLDRERLALLIPTCTCAMVGADYRRVAQEASGRRQDSPVLHVPTWESRPLAGWTQSPPSSQTRPAPRPGIVPQTAWIDDFVAHVLSRTPAALREAQAYHVNVFGLASGPSLDELRNVLARLGVTLNAALLPSLRPSEISLLERARVDIYCESLDWRAFYDRFQARRPNAVVNTGFPFGRASTLGWIREASHHAGVTPSQESLDALLAPTEERWRRGTREAHGHGLAFVVTSASAHKLLEPRFTWGIPLLSMVAEMGFSLHVIVVLDHAQARFPAFRERLTESQPSVALQVDTVRSLDALNAALQDSPSGAVFSTVTQDLRVSRAGKNVFVPRDFQMGLVGAVDTLERLLRVCETPFYRRFRSYLGPAPTASPRLWPELDASAAAPAEALERRRATEHPADAPASGEALASTVLTRWRFRDRRGRLPSVVLVLRLGNEDWRTEVGEGGQDARVVEAVGEVVTAFAKGHLGAQEERSAEQWTAAMSLFLAGTRLGERFTASCESVSGGDDERDLGGGR